jgi:tRNA threonylcarbamoyladenosine biosynthesis protein TsaB
LLILALDTTSRAGSVAVLRRDVVLAETSGDPSRTHGQRLPGDLLRTLDAAGARVAQLDLLAVVAGPGSFTGLRVGIASMQGLAFARRLQIVPVSSLEALASQAAGDDTAGSPLLAPWIDAQRGEVFAQVFEQGSGFSYRARHAAISAGPDAVLEMQAPDLDGTVFHGDGALKFRDAIQARLGGGVEIVDPVRPLAGAIGRVAHEHPERAVAPHAIMPIYVRRPDAELARERRSGGA